MLFTPINTEDQVSLQEKDAKSLEQQRQELERFDEMKSSYRRALDCIGNKDMAQANNILLDLNETDLYSAKTLEGKTLQKAVMKLILSLNTSSAEAYLDICLKGLELFPDERYFLKRSAEILFQEKRFRESALMFEQIFRQDPQSKDSLQQYVECLKRGFLFEELDKLYKTLKEANWMPIAESEFHWRTQLGELSKTFEDNSSDHGSTAIDVLSVPLKDVNWANYAAVLNTMAIGNYSQVFKKTPFNPDNYAILSGPCAIEISSSSSQSQTQSLLSGLLDFSASSLDDVSATTDTNSNVPKKRANLRRKETKPNSQLVKTDVTVNELVKTLGAIFALSEAHIINELTAHELKSLQLLDKNVLISDSCDDCSDRFFGIENLIQRIREDNDIHKPLALRIFELLKLFFVDSVNQPFPNNVPGPLADLFGLFNFNILSIDNFKEFLGSTDHSTFLVGLCEVFHDLKRPIYMELSLVELVSSQLSNSDRLRLQLLQALSLLDSSSKNEELKKFAAFLQNESINTRYFSSFQNSQLNSSIVMQALSEFDKSSQIEEIQLLASSEEHAKEALKLLGESLADRIRFIEQTRDGNQIRLLRILLSNEDSLEVEIKNRLACLGLETLLFCFNGMEVNEFFDHLSFFIFIAPKIATSSTFLKLMGMFWCTYAHKALVPNNTVASLNASFVSSISLLLRSRSSMKPDHCRFFLQWASQERAFGSKNGILPLSVFDRFSSSDCLAERRFAYCVAFSLFRFPNIFISIDPDDGWEEWDRSPIGSGNRDAPCPSLQLSTLISLSQVVAYFHEIDEEASSCNSPIAAANNRALALSEPGLVGFIDWLNKQFEELKETAVSGLFHTFSLNRQSIHSFMTLPLLAHTEGSVLDPNRQHLEVPTYGRFEAFRILLNMRAFIVHSELQGRKKSFSILKTLRSHLKASLALNPKDPDVWKLLGCCYYDAAVHFMSGETELLADVGNSGKLKRCVKKGILALKQGLKLEADLTHQSKLVDLLDWALHDPAGLLLENEAAAPINRFLCSLGCRAVQASLNQVTARDRWSFLLRFEFFLRKLDSGCSIAATPQNLLGILRQAVTCASSCLSENVYESTALFMSAVKFYSRLFKLRLAGVLSTEELGKELAAIQSVLPDFLQTTSDSAVHHLLLALEALGALDRKKIFHAHYMCSALTSWKLLNDSKSAQLAFEQVFPFLKSPKLPLIQVYQSDHERPARFLVAGRRYLLRLLDFFEDSIQKESSSEALIALADQLTLLLKKLHYLRKTILGFPQLLFRASQVYIDSLAPKLISLSIDAPDQVMSVVWELVDSLEQLAVARCGIRALKAKASDLEQALGEQEDAEQIQETNNDESE